MYSIVSLPPSKVWPANLVLCALFNTLHSQEYIGMGKRGGLSREKFFIFSLGIATIYCKSLPACHQTQMANDVPYAYSHPRFPSEDFFPGYLFTALSTFSWVCWIAPNNGTISLRFGVVEIWVSVCSHDLQYNYSSSSSGTSMTSLPHTFGTVSLRELIVGSPSQAVKQMFGWVYLGCRMD